MKMNTDRALDTKTLHWNRVTMTFSEEASTCRFHTLYQLYDDACDEGVWVKSHVTGNLEAFTFERVEMDETGEDTLAWHFTLTRYGNNPIRLVIYND